VDVLVTLSSHIDLRVSIYNSKLAIPAPILSLEHEVQQHCKDDNEPGEAAANGAPPNIEWAREMLASRQFQERQVNSLRVI
jgi:hypothetical protein